MLNVVVLDTLDSTEVSDLLKAAYTRRELPIKQLVVYNELPPLLDVSAEQLARCNVLIACFEKVKKEYIEFSQKLRRKSESIFIVFVVDREADITAFARPSVRPSGILFIPPEKERIYQTIKEIYIEYMRASERVEQPVFTVKIGGEYYSVNTGDISFLEAQGKRIAIKTRGQEILFYSNFETVLEQLPDWFIRCHKGFVVNAKQIIQTSFTEMTLKLKDQSVIPISRTYRDEIRSLIDSKGASH